MFVNRLIHGTSTYSEYVRKCGKALTEESLNSSFFLEEDRFEPAVLINTREKHERLCLASETGFGSDQ